MRYLNQVKNSIKEELEKDYPSKKKILSFLFNKQLKEEFQTLPETQVFDIFGETFSLNPMFFTDQLYNDIKKKIKKVHGGEGVKFMEQYLIKSYGLYSPEHILDTIKEEYNPTDPSKDVNWRLHLKTKVSAIFSGLLSKKEYQHLSKSDFNIIVEETLKIDPEFFMDSIYYDLRQKMNKQDRLEMDRYIIEKYSLIDGEFPEFFMDSIYYDLRRKMNKQDRLEMDRYIIEKYSLIDGEHIIYECNGNLTFVDSQKVKASGGLNFSGNLPVVVLITYGNIFITNYRIIAQGNNKIKGGRNPFWGSIGMALSGESRRNETRKTILKTSPTYGYHFPSKIHVNLKKWRNYVTYICIEDNQFKQVEIKITSATPQAERDEQVHAIFKILSKDLGFIKETIKVLLEMELKDKWKKQEIIALLVNLRESEEYEHITDSDYLDIVETTYKTNPQFFIKKIYPKIESLKRPSMEPIKNDVIKLIENLNNKT